MTSVRPVSYTEGEKVLVYNPHKKWGKCGKWSVCWHGPVTVLRKLNDSNYVVVHVDRMRKLPVSQDVNLSFAHAH